MYNFFQIKVVLRIQEFPPDFRERIIYFLREINGYQNVATRLMLGKNAVDKIVQNWKKIGKAEGAVKRSDPSYKLIPMDIRYIRKL